MKKSLKSMLILFAFATFITSCRETKEDKVEDAVENVEDSVEDTADDVEDAVDD